jgi:hypothetical protein
MKEEIKKLLSKMMFQIVLSVCCLVFFCTATSFAQNNIDRNSTWNNLNNGWPRAIEEGLSQQNGGSLLLSDKNYILVFALTPVKPLDLRSPEHLKQTISSQLLDFQAGKASGGHFMVGWQCQSPLGVSKGMTGLSGERSGQTMKLIENGWGLNSYLATFTDGYLQTPSPRLVPGMAQSEIENLENYTLQWYFNQKKDEKSNFSFIVLEVESSQCQMARNYVENFLKHPANPQTNFGSLHDPKKFEGGGCISFADAFLNEAEAFTDILPEMWRNVSLSENVFGLGQLDLQGRPTSKDENGDLAPIPKVSLQKKFSPKQPSYVGFNALFNMNWNIYPDEHHFSFRQMDPELFYFFFQELGRNITSETQQLIDKKQLEKYFNQSRYIQRLNFNASDSNSTFLTDKIDEEYDQEYGGNAKRIKEKTQHYFQSEKNDKEWKIFEFRRGFGILIGK